MKNTKVRNLILIVISLAVLLPIGLYFDSIPTAEETRRQEERQKEEEEDRKEEEARQKEKQEEEQKEAERKAKWDEEAKIREEEQAKKAMVGEWADKAQTFFQSCTWKNVIVTDEGNFYLEDYNNDYSDNTELTFNITQVSFEIGTEVPRLFVKLGNEYKEVCPSGDHSVFVQVLKKFKEAVKAEMLGD